MSTVRNLIFILGDQLTWSLSSLEAADPGRDIILMCEVIEEATYAHHHKLKMALIFSAMRHFAIELREKGFDVRYVHLDDVDNTGSFTGELARTVAAISPKRIIVTEVRIPLKPAMDSETKPATRSDFIPASVPI